MINEVPLALPLKGKFLFSFPPLLSHAFLFHLSAEVINSPSADAIADAMLRITADAIVRRYWIHVITHFFLNSHKLNDKIIACEPS